VAATAAESGARQPYKPPGLRRAGGSPIPASPRRGVLFAVLSYLSFGFLSPVGRILLESMEPFTLNAIRTLLALPLMVVLFGLRTTREALRLVRRDPQVWILGAFWLGLTFVPYLWSLKYLPPTITTVTVYATPLLVAAWQRFRWRQAVSPLVLPTVALTVVGAILAVRSPGGVTLDGDGRLGLVLALLGVIGWSGYTIQLARLTPTRDPNVLTLAAFLTSGFAFLVGSLAFEGARVVLDRTTVLWLVLYIVFPGVVSLWLYSLSLRHTDAATVAVLIGVELIATAIVSYFLRLETFTADKVAGLGLVLVAVTLYLANERRRVARVQTLK
jgi:drug/metabolite transporter (DMT)-like permease